MQQTTQLQHEIEEMLRTRVPEVEVLLTERPSPGVVRVTIDRPGGAVDLDLCERVSRELGAVRERYALEVSSPGIERPLVKPAHYRQVIGNPVSVRTTHPLDGRSSFKGVLTEAADETILIDQDGEPVRIPYAEIRRANLVVEVGGTR